jgi:hypothetical protein
LRRLPGRVRSGGKGLGHAGILGSAGPRVLSTSRISAGRAFPPAGLHRPLQTLCRRPAVARDDAVNLMSQAASTQPVGPMRRKKME